MQTMADRFSYSCRRNQSSNNLSFSSTLLEEIYESIDSGGDEGESMRKKRDDVTTRFLFETEEEMANYQRACMIERWMEKKTVGRGRSIAELQEKMSGKDRQCSSSSSSDSSCGRGGGFFSSSEAESFAVPPPKPVRTGKSVFEKEKKAKNRDDSGINRRGNFIDGSDPKSKSESGFVKTKSKAQKIYGDLKRAKQPTSPGGRVAAFLNSIFAAGNLKKSKTPAACGGGDTPALKSRAATTCSSPFSRSCLSRMASPSSAKSAAITKRSARFFPARDEDRRACGRKSLLNGSGGDVDSIVAAIDEELAMHVRKKEHSFDIFSKIRDQNRGFDREFDDEDDEFDGVSCASSDLFELENLSSIGMEELPVYETTHLQKIMQMD